MLVKIFHKFKPLQCVLIEYLGPESAGPTRACLVLDPSTYSHLPGFDFRLLGLLSVWPAQL